MFVSQIFDEVLDILGTTDRAKGLRKLTQAVQVLMQSGHYFHINAEADICTGWDGMTLTLPRGVEVPLGVNVDGSPTYFRGRLFQYHVNKGGMYNPVQWAWDDRGMVATQMDIRQPSQLVAVAEHASDAGKIIRVIGTDGNNRELRSQTKEGVGLDGILIPIHAQSDFPYGTIAPDGVTIVTRRTSTFPFTDLTEINGAAHQFISGVQAILTHSGQIPAGLTDKQKYYVGEVIEGVLGSTKIRLFNTEIDAKNGTNPIRMQSILNSAILTLTDERPINMVTSINLPDGVPAVEITTANEVTFSRRDGSNIITSLIYAVGATGTQITSIVANYENGSSSANLLAFPLEVFAGWTRVEVATNMLGSVNNNTSTTGFTASSSSFSGFEAAVDLEGPETNAIVSLTYTTNATGFDLRYQKVESDLLPNPLKEDTAYFVRQVDAGSVNTVDMKVYSTLNDAQNDINEITLTGSNGSINIFIRKELAPQTKLVFSADPGYATGDTVTASTNGGTLPQPLIAGQNYYVSVLDETPVAVMLHETYADAIAGLNPISLTTAGTGQNSIARLLPATASSGTRNNISVSGLNLPSASGSGAVVVPQVTGPVTTMSVISTGGGYSTATCSITDVGGYKYIGPPTVLLQNGNFTVPATLSASIATDPATNIGYVSSVAVVDGGQGYDASNPPTVVFSGGLAAGGFVPNASVTIDKGIPTGTFTTLTRGQNLSIGQQLVFKDTIVGGSGAIGYITQPANSKTSPGNSITSGTVSGGIGTLTFALPHGLKVSDSITLTGFSPAGWNATFFILSIVSTTQVTVSSASLTAMTAYGTYTYSDGSVYSIVKSGSGYSAPSIVGVLLNPNPIQFSAVSGTATISSIKVFDNGELVGKELLSAPITGITTPTGAATAVALAINSNTSASLYCSPTASGSTVYAVSCLSLKVLTLGNVGSTISLTYTSVTNGPTIPSGIVSAPISLFAAPYTIVSADTTTALLASKIAAQINANTAATQFSASVVNDLVIIKPLYNVFANSLVMTTNGSTTYYATTCEQITKTTITVSAGTITLAGEITSPVFPALSTTGVVSGVTLLPYGSGATANVSVNSISGAINGVSITQTGTGYLYPPRVSISAPNQQNAQLQVIAAGAGGATVTQIQAKTSTGSTVTILSTTWTNGSSPSVTTTAAGIAALINQNGYSAAVSSSSIDTIIVYAPTGVSISSFFITTAGTAPAIQLQSSIPIQATASTTITTSFVTGYKVAASGKGYTTAPAINVSGGGGNGASATAVIDRFGIGSISVVSGGSGYPSVLLAVIADSGGGTGYGASANVTVSNGTIVAVSMTNYGRGYTAPTISWVDPAGGVLPSGANAAVVEFSYTGVLTNVNVVAEGTGYTSQPTVTVTPSTGVFVSFTSTGVLPTPLVQGQTYRAENPSSGSGFTLKNTDFSDVNLTSTGSGNLFLVLSRSFSIGFTGLWNGDFSGSISENGTWIRLQSDYQLPITDPESDSVTNYYITKINSTSAKIFKNSARTIQLIPTQLGVGQAYYGIGQRAVGSVYKNRFRPNSSQYLASGMQVRFSSLDGVLPAPLVSTVDYSLVVDGPNMSVSDIGQITNISTVGDASLLTFSSPHNLSVGSIVTLFGCLPSVWNTAFYVQIVQSPTQIVVYSAGLPTMTSFGYYTSDSVVQITSLGHGNVSMIMQRQFIADAQTELSSENCVFETGDEISVRPSPGDTLPYPLIQSSLANPTAYFVRRNQPNSFELYSSREAALSGDPAGLIILATTGNTVDSFFYSDLVKPPTLVKSIFHVEKPETIGYVSLYAFDYGRSNDMALIGQYHPSETNPKYRRIRLGKPCAWARVIYRVASPNFTSEYDYIPLESPRAIIAAVHAVDLEDKDFMEQAQKYWQVAVTYLKNENESMDGHAMQPPQINNLTFGDGTDPVMF